MPFNADFDRSNGCSHSKFRGSNRGRFVLSTNNILSPSNGKPIIVPNQDIVLGIYYLSQALIKLKQNQRIFSSVEEIEQALENKSISLHTKIISIFRTVDNTEMKSWRNIRALLEILLANLLPINSNIKFNLINKLLTKNVSEVIDTIFRYCGQKRVVFSVIG